MTQPGRDLENTFRRSWGLLVRNWVIVVPGLVLAVAGAALSVLVGSVLLRTLFVSGGGFDVDYVSQIIYAVAMIAIEVLVSIVQLAFVTGMAGAAWQHGRTGLSDGWAAFSRRLVPVSVASMLLFAIGICAAALAPATFFVTLAIYVLFMIYTMASVVIGRRTAIAAIAESCRLALANAFPTIAIVGLIALLAVAGGVAGSLIGRVSPFAGGLAAGVVQQIIVAYASLVIAGEYLKLAKQPVA